MAITELINLNKKILEYLINLKTDVMKINQSFNQKTSKQTVQSNSTDESSEETFKDTNIVKPVFVDKEIDIQEQRNHLKSIQKGKDFDPNNLKYGIIVINIDFKNDKEFIDFVCKAGESLQSKDINYNAIFSISWFQ